MSNIAVTLSTWAYLLLNCNRLNYSELTSQFFLYKQFIGDKVITIIETFSQTYMCDIVPSESLRNRSLYEKDTHLQKSRLQVSGNNGLSETKSVMCESYIKSNIDYR